MTQACSYLTGEPGDQRCPEPGTVKLRVVFTKPDRLSQEQPPVWLCEQHAALMTVSSYRGERGVRVEIDMTDEECEGCTDE